MALVPTLFRDWWEDFERPSSLLDQHFGLGLNRDELLNTLSFPSFRGYFRPWRNLVNQTGGTAKIQNDKDKFQVNDIFKILNFLSNLFFCIRNIFNQIK